MAAYFNRFMYSFVQQSGQGHEQQQGALALGGPWLYRHSEGQEEY